MKKITLILLVMLITTFGCSVKAQFVNNTNRTLYGQLADYRDNFDWDDKVIVYSNSTEQAKTKNRGDDSLYYRYWDANYDTYTAYTDLTNCNFYGSGTNLFRGGSVVITNTNRNNAYITE